jgi:hypothetical protein
MSLTIGILSWGQHKTLLNTLQSYSDWGLLYKPDVEYLIFFQEINERDEEIANLYGFDYFGMANNIGIAGGYRKLVEATTSEHFLFLENDWELLRYPWGQLLSAQTALATREFDVVRFRHRTQPGNPLWTRQFAGNEMSRPEHLLDCIHWVDEPTQFSQIYYLEPFWYTTSRYANWTNNPTMFRTKFLEKYILPRMGSRDVELDIQQWWQEQNFWVAQGEGLFTHNRL